MSSASLSRRLTIIVGACLVVFLLFYLRPYYGIRHDAILYLGQGLLRLDPDNFRNDLFFAYGGQTGFTLFPYLLAWGLKTAAAAHLFKWMTVLGLLAFAATSYTLLRQCLPSRDAFFALVSILCMPTFYGGFTIISYAEAFFTGRTLAEPLILLGLAAYLGKRWLVSIGLLTGAALLHPLQTLPALLVIYIDLASHDRRWWHACWLLIPVMAAPILAPTLAGHLFDHFDENWLSQVNEANPMVFLANWSTRDWMLVITDLFLLTLAIRESTGNTRRLIRAALVAMIASFLATYVLADWAKLILPTGIQIWRTHWLAHWLAMAVVPLLLGRLATTDGWLSPRVVLLILILLLGLPTATWQSHGYVNLLLIPFFLIWPTIKSRISPKISRLVVIAAALLATILLVKLGLLTVSEYARLGRNRQTFRPEFLIISYPLVAASLAAAILYTTGYWQSRSTPMRWKILPLIISIAAAAISVSSWDRRSTWTHYIEDAKPSPTFFGTSLETGAQIYWAEEIVAPWMLLGRPSYFNSSQTSGLVFSAKTAEEARRRIDILKEIEFQTGVCRIMNELNKNPSSCEISLEAVQRTCHAAEGQLKYLVLDSVVEKAKPMGTWAVQAGFHGEVPMIYHLYSCADFASLPRNTGIRK